MQLRRLASPYLLILPSFLLATLIILWPLKELVQIATHEVNRFGQLRDFAGAANFQALLADPDFIASAWRTLIWTIGVVGGALVVSAPVALILNQDFYGRGLARVIVMLPWAVSLTMTAIVWRWALSGESGMLNSALRGTGIIDQNIQWLANAATAFPMQILIGILATAACVALFVCTGMIYACLKFLQEWHTPLTVINYAMLGTASGVTAAAALSAWLQPALARPFALAALVAGALAYVLRLASLSRNARLRPKSTLASAIGVKHPRIVQIAQGAMGGSFNTREFFHGRPREVVRAVRWVLLICVFPLPALLMLAGNSLPFLICAFLLQYAGLLAERWYFFAEARHPQNLYYQAIA